jgi:hypothetical protein
MRAHAALALLALAACVKEGSLDRSAPTGRRADHVDVTDVPVKGFNVSIELLTGPPFTGELLAIDDTNVYILVDQKTLGIPRGAVQKASIDLMPATGVAAGIWTAAGTASTLTHGYFLVFTAPIWLGAGIPSTVAASSHESYVDAPNPELGRIYQFARFPQGLPVGWPYTPLSDGGAELPATRVTPPPVRVRALDAGIPDAPVEE